MAYHAPFVALYRSPSRTISVNRRPRGTAQWRGRSLSGIRGRSGRLGSGVPRLCKLASRPLLRRTVSALLRRQWSPEHSLRHVTDDDRLKEAPRPAPPSSPSLCVEKTRHAVSAAEVAAGASNGKIRVALRHLVCHMGEIGRHQEPLE